MTEQKVIETLEYIRYCNEYKGCAESIALDMAIKAMEKQIPKKVVAEKGETFALTKDGKESYLFRYRCPSCNRIIRFFESNNFCMFCGQAIDWSKEE